MKTITLEFDNVTHRKAASCYQKQRGKMSNYYVIVWDAPEKIVACRPGSWYTENDKRTRLKL